MTQSKITIPDTKQLAINGVLQSISNHGLVPLSQIPKSVLANPVTQVQSLDGDICVNYVNLHKADAAETRLALSLAVEEEWCGIYGICLERQWTFQRFSSIDLLQAEASARLLQSMVFILNPPPNKMGNHILSGGKIPTAISCYEPGKEGCTQQRARSVSTGSMMAYSNRITEIKTPHNFNKNEIMAVLVPEQLVEMAKEFFPDLKIIPVISKVLTLHAIPKILELYHNEILKKPLKVEAPDYLGAIKTYCENEHLITFSLHAVRLHTDFDFIIRPIAKIAGNEHIINSTYAKIAKKFDDDSAFIIVHKNYGQSKLNLIERLRVHKFLPEDLIVKMERGCQFSIAMNTGLTKLKGGLIISNAYKDLSEVQLSLLADPCLKVIRTEHFFVLAYPPRLEEYVNSVVNKFHESVTKIQAFSRGLRVRTFFEDYRQKQENLKIAQQELELAGEQLKNITS